MDTVLHLINHTAEFYKWSLTIADKRVEQWPMMSSPLPTLSFSVLYLLFLWAGPRYMQHRDAFKLRKTLIVYNFSMVLLNFYICIELLLGSRAGGYSYLCQPVNYSDDVNELRIQFHVTIGHAAHSLYSGCLFPAWMQWTLIAYAITFIILFANFYYQTYRPWPRSKSPKNACNGVSAPATPNGSALSSGVESEHVKENGRKHRKERMKKE